MTTVVVHPTTGLVLGSIGTNANDHGVENPSLGTSQSQLASNDGDPSYLESQPGVGGGTFVFGGGVGTVSAEVIGGNLIGSGAALPADVVPAQAYVRVVAEATAGAPAFFVVEVIPAPSTVGFVDTFLAEASCGSVYGEVRVPFPTCPTDIDESGFASLYRIRLWPRANGDRGANWIRVTELAVVVPSAVTSAVRQRQIPGQVRQRQVPGLVRQRQMQR